MNDMADVWVSHRQRSADKRASNRASSAGVLRARGVDYTSHNDGAHLVVADAHALLGHGHVIDFWPGTGLWKVRGSLLEGRGVRSLLKFLKNTS